MLQLQAPVPFYQLAVSAATACEHAGYRPWRPHVAGTVSALVCVFFVQASILFSLVKTLRAGSESHLVSSSTGPFLVQQPQILGSNPTRGKNASPFLLHFVQIWCQMGRSLSELPVRRWRATTSIRRLRSESDSARTVFLFSVLLKTPTTICILQN
jgi:hypothetical protein